MPASGCGGLWVVDGQWKLKFAHCMMKRKVGNFVICQCLGFCVAQTSITNCVLICVVCVKCAVICKMLTTNSLSIELHHGLATDKLPGCVHRTTSIMGALFVLSTSLSLRKTMRVFQQLSGVF